MLQNFLLDTYPYVLNGAVQFNYCYKYCIVDVAHIAFRLCMQIPRKGCNMCSSTFLLAIVYFFCSQILFQNNTLRIRRRLWVTDELCQGRTPNRSHSFLLFSIFVIGVSRRIYFVLFVHKTLFQNTPVLKLHVTRSHSAHCTGIFLNTSDVTLQFSAQIFKKKTPAAQTLKCSCTQYS